jgi:hypothetical protein
MRSTLCNEWLDIFCPPILGQKIPLCANAHNGFFASRTLSEKGGGQLITPQLRVPHEGFVHLLIRFADER